MTSTQSPVPRDVILDILYHEDYRVNESLVGDFVNIMLSRNNPFCVDTGETLVCSDEHPFYRNSPQAALVCGLVETELKPQWIRPRSDHKFDNFVHLVEQSLYQAEEMFYKDPKNDLNLFILDFEDFDRFVMVVNVRRQSDTYKIAYSYHRFRLALLKDSSRNMFTRDLKTLEYMREVIARFWDVTPVMLRHPRSSPGESSSNTGQRTERSSSIDSGDDTTEPTSNTSV